MYKKTYPDRLKSPIEQAAEEQRTPSPSDAAHNKGQLFMTDVQPVNSNSHETVPKSLRFELQNVNHETVPKSLRGLPAIQITTYEGLFGASLSPPSPIASCPGSPPPYYPNVSGQSRPSSGSQKATTFHRRGEDFYPMDHKQRGDFIIFNFNVFGENVREGAGVDTVNLFRCFSSLGFNVISMANCTTEEVFITIDKCLHTDYTDKDCFGIALLGHGKDGSIITENGELLLDTIIDRVKERKNLLNKPKLFFIQSCRLKGPVDADSPIPSPDINDDSEVIPSTPSVPIEADIFISYATTKGNKAFRLKDTGSPYIQVLTEVLEERGATESILDLMTIVNCKVKAMMRRFGMSQITVMESTLSKKLIFDKIEEERRCRIYRSGRIEAQ